VEGSLAGPRPNRRWAPESEGRFSDALVFTPAGASTNVPGLNGQRPIDRVR
jgi:hypothetical protein